MFGLLFLLAFSFSAKLSFTPANGELIKNCNNEIDIMIDPE